MTFPKQRRFDQSDGFDQDNVFSRISSCQHCRPDMNLLSFIEQGSGDRQFVEVFYDELELYVDRLIVLHDDGGQRFEGEEIFDGDLIPFGSYGR
jgi:hypothetical protein